ncbi:hypothetical protein ACGFRB_28950 [Streptomyces sp. NPDC048718]
MHELITPHDADLDPQLVPDEEREDTPYDEAMPHDEISSGS